MVLKSWGRQVTLRIIPSVVCLLLPGGQFSASSESWCGLGSCQWISSVIYSRILELPCMLVLFWSSCSISCWLQFPDLYILKVFPVIITEVSLSETFQLTCKSCFSFSFFCSWWHCLVCCFDFFICLYWHVPLLLLLLQFDLWKLKVGTAVMQHLGKACTNIFSFYSKTKI